MVWGEHRDIISMGRTKEYYLAGQAMYLNYIELIFTRRKISLAAKGEPHRR